MIQFRILVTLQVGFISLWQQLRLVRLATSIALTVGSSINGDRGNWWRAKFPAASCHVQTTDGQSPNVFVLTVVTWQIMAVECPFFDMIHGILTGLMRIYFKVVCNWFRAVDG